MPKQDIFKSNQSGYAFFRLPAIVFHEGTFFVFCEGRYTRSDRSVMDIVLRRGTLEGSNVTWGEIQVVASQQNASLHNPVPIVDQETNTVFVLYQADGTKIYSTKSTDLGQTWTSPVNVTDQITADSGSNAVENFFTASNAGVLLSDDHGDKWYVGGLVPKTTPGGTGVYTDETSVALLADDSICLNSRTLGKCQPRAQSFSQDGGKTFGPLQMVPNLIEPTNGCGVAAGCEGSVLGFPSPDGSSERWALFSNPASKVFRFRMSIRLSRDGCKTWSNAWKIRCCASGYSDLTQYSANEVSNPNFAIVYENGVFDSIGKITFQTFNLSNVTQGISCCSCCCCTCC
ncbi:sialidase-like isoform X2 [Amphiura filiformis]|uniref:sialidase-like isoform X2 n=1 Tax=Amphiura filiformis TaxID=82378 RepID=UPI003B21B36D